MSCSDEIGSTDIVIELDYRIPEFNRLRFEDWGCFHSLVYEMEFDDEEIRLLKVDHWAETENEIIMDMNINLMDRISNLIISLKQAVHVNTNGIDKIISSTTHVLTLLNDNVVVESVEDISGGAILSGESDENDSFCKLFTELFG